MTSSNPIKQVQAFAGFRGALYKTEAEAERSFQLEAYNTVKRELNSLLTYNQQHLSFDPAQAILNCAKTVEEFLAAARRVFPKAGDRGA